MLATPMLRIPVAVCALWQPLGDSQLSGRPLHGTSGCLLWPMVSYEMKLLRAGMGWKQALFIISKNIPFNNKAQTVRKRSSVCALG